MYHMQPQGDGYTQPCAANATGREIQWVVLWPVRCQRRARSAGRIAKPSSKAEMAGAVFSPDTERLQQREMFEGRLLAALVAELRLIVNVAGLWALINWRRRGIVALLEFGTRRLFHLLSA
jgi:hypothetical protein